MKIPNAAIVATRPINNITSLHSVRRWLLTRTYATQNTTGASSATASKRRSVTPFNDDGYVAWTDLSAGEKAARATQQSFNFGMVIVGLVLTVGL